jgi:predicted anti-sigma-YlaC factor YlaD
MTGMGHLTRETLVRSFDCELSTDERLELEQHLGQCADCLEEFDRISDLSSDIARLVDRTRVVRPRQAREQLVEKMAASASHEQSRGLRSRLVLWAAAAAALIALVSSAGVYSIARHSRSLSPKIHADVEQRGTESPVESTDLPFVRLPYSNPALPLESEQIVRVNMRVSDLASTGVVAMTTPASDAWVQADVLLGMDGEPYGIHLLESAPRNQEGFKRKKQ